MNACYNLNEPYLCRSCNKQDVWLNFEGYENVCHSCGDVHSVEFGVDTTEFFKESYCWNYCNFYQAKFHFNERMSQWCGEEPHIPDADLRTIFAACGKYIRSKDGDRDAEFKLRTKSDIQRILRTLGKKFSKKYLEKWLTIIRKYNREMPYPHPSSELVRTLQGLFNSIMEPWYKTKPPNRKHLPNYNYIIRQLLYIIDPKYEEIYGFCFPLLNSKRKLHALDILWEPICDFNEWEFRPLCQKN